MSDKEKLKALKKFLKDRGISYWKNVSTKFGVTLDLSLMVNGWLIAVHLSDDNDNEFYKKIVHCYKPFFIRDDESVEFVIEKMTNLISELNNKQSFKEHLEEVAKRKERNRKYYEECLERHQKNIDKAIKKTKNRRPETPQPKRKRQRIIRVEKIECK